MFKLCLEKKIHPLPFPGGCRGARRGIFRGKINKMGAFIGIRFFKFPKLLKHFGQIYLSYRV